MTPFIGQIMMFGGNFAPRGWALCDGQLLSISSYSALFSILGTTYGGDGVSTFGLPDLRGRAPIHMGTGPGLTHRSLGAKSGAETVTLTTNQMPSHSHDANCTSSLGNLGSPEDGIWAAEAGDRHDLYSNETATGTMSSSAIANAGGGQAHDNMQPYQVINFVIALEGVYPSRA